MNELQSRKQNWSINRTDIMQEIDSELKHLILLVNDNPDFCTILSCAGHFRLCKDYFYNLNAISFDDNELNVYEDLMNYDDNLSRHCNGTTQPFLEFFCIRNVQTTKFLQDLSSKIDSLTHQVHYKRTKNDLIYRVEYGYGDLDEGYHEEYCGMKEQLTGHKFRLFWEHFANCWNKCVAPVLSMSLIPSKFKLNDVCYCQKSKPPVKQTGYNEKKRKYLQTELFEDDIWDMCYKFRNTPNYCMSQS